MPEPTRRVDLRLTIPAKAPFRELAADLAVKFAEYAGVSRDRSADVHAAVEAALAAATSDSVDLEMASQGDELVMTTNPSSRRATFPLTD